MKRWNEFFWAAVLSGIFTFVVLAMHPAFAWIAAPLGALVGYFSVAFKDVVKAIPQAWKRTINWKPDRKFWKEWAVSQLIYFLGVSAFLSTLTLFGIFGAFLGGHSPVLTKTSVEIFFAAFVSAGLFLGIFQSFITDHNPNELKDSAKEMFKFTNPFSVAFFLGIYFPIGGVIWCWKRKGKALAFLQEFIKLVHSERRKVRAMSVFLGVMIGYFAGSVFVGAIAGGVIAEIAIQLVARRVFHIEPA